MRVAPGIRAPAALRAPPAPAGLLALAVAAFAFRAILVLRSPGYVPAHDDHDYARVAWSMAEGRGYPPVRLPGADGHVHLFADGWRPPLWPAVLAGILSIAADPTGAGALPHVIPGLTPARLGVAALGALAVVLTAVLARRLWGSRAGWWAGALAAVYLPLALLATVLLSETLFVCLELAALLVALDGRTLRRAGLAGALVGLAWLTRSNGVLLLLPVAILVASGGPRAPALARVAATFVACLVVVSPWTLRNASVFHAFVPVSTETGGTLIGTYNAASMEDRRNPGGWRLLPDTPFRHAVARGTPPSEADRRMRDLALGFVADHPAYVVTVVAWNLRRGVGLAGRERWRFEASRAGIGPRAADAATVCAWIVILLALAGVALGAARGAPVAVWFAALVLLGSAAGVIMETPRLRAPVDPFLLAVAGAGLAEMTRRVERRRRAARSPVSSVRDARGAA